MTIEIEDSSDQNISNLKFSFGYLENIEFQELGDINQLKPGESSKLYIKSINPTDADLSMYMRYHLKNGEQNIESLAYLDFKNPIKVVVLADITKVDDYGYLFINYKGFNSFTQFDGEINPDRQELKPFIIKYKQN